MTEAEWRSSEDPAAMLAWRTGRYPDGTRVAVGGCLSDRKLRLFACACCRQVWHLLTDERSRRAVEVAERYADGAVGAWECEMAAKGASDADEAARRAEPRAHWAASWAADTRRPGEVARALLYLPRNAAAQAALLREIVGNPFRPVSRSDQHGSQPGVVIPARFFTPTVLSIARAAYDERLTDGSLDPARLAVLSDALEEAGCTDEAVLRHLRGWVPEISTGLGLPPGEVYWMRSPGPHVRGCRALDLILGKW